MYGAPLSVPGDFISSYSTCSDSKFQLQRLRDQVRSLAPIPTSQHGVVPDSVPRDLQQAKFVFIRRDAHRTPFQRPYEGPYKVIQPGFKTFKIDRGGRPETVTVDRLKPAHIDLEHPVQPSVPQSHGRPLANPQPAPTYVQVQPTTTTHTPPKACSNNIPVQDVALNFHNVTSRFWGERCSGGNLRTTYTENLVTFVLGMLIREHLMYLSCCCCTKKVVATR